MLSVVPMGDTALIREEHQSHGNIQCSSQCPCSTKSETQMKMDHQIPLFVYEVSS